MEKTTANETHFSQIYTTCHTQCLLTTYTSSLIIWKFAHRQ